MEIYRWLVCLFTLCVIFSQQILVIPLIYGYRKNESPVLFFIVVFSLSLLILFRDLYRKNNYRTKTVLAVAVVILFLYILTPLLFVDTTPAYTSFLLQYIAISIPSLILGCHMAISRDLDKIDVMLPFFLLFFGASFIPIAIETSFLTKLANSDDQGLNYQSLSYFLVDISIYSAYCILFSSLKKLKFFRFFRWVMLFLAIVSTVCTFLPGGRGALIVLFVSIIFNLFFYARYSKLKVVVIILVSILLSSYFISYFDVTESLGFARSSSSLFDITNRARGYSLSLKAIFDSPIIGNGLGSVGIILGGYSHNIFLDLLLEVGLVGTILVTYMIIKTFTNLIILSKVNSSHFFFFLLFLRSFVYSLFSGYWLIICPFWFVFGYVYSRRRIVLSNHKIKIL